MRSTDGVDAGDLVSRLLEGVDAVAKILRPAGGEVIALPRAAEGQQAGGQALHLVDLPAHLANVAGVVALDDVGVDVGGVAAELIGGTGERRPGVSCPSTPWEGLVDGEDAAPQTPVQPGRGER